jgi:hypothetical protein
MMDMEMQRFISHANYQPDFDLICSVHTSLAFQGSHAQIGMPHCHIGMTLEASAF